MRSFSYYTSAEGSGGGHYIELQEGKFMELLRALVATVDVDEDWYRKTYQDVDQAIRAGDMSSARQHYVTAGYFENRFPRQIKVDERWYLDEYSDVAEAIQRGSIVSAAQHFEQEGFKEGRLPQHNWSLISERALRQMELS